MDDQVSSEDISADESDALFAEVMQKQTTVPESLIITLTNFADEKDAQHCADVLRGYLGVFGRLMDLSHLDHVYVTFDYEGTLATLDRGTSSGLALKPTNDEVAIGVAMAPSVKREDGWKSVIVINAAYARTLSYEENDSTEINKEQLEALRAETLHILAHECGHVHDHAMQTRSLPENTFSQTWSPIESLLKESAMACWSEYIAEYLSAGFGTKGTLAGYETAFRGRLKIAWPAITASVRQYRMHGNIDQVISEVGLHIRNVIIYAAYVLGHLSHTERSFENGVPKAAQDAEDNAELGIYIKRLEHELHRLHDKYPDFTSLEVFSPISEVIHDMYKTAGLTFVQNADKTLRVDIPHRADTLPNWQEQFEFLYKRDTPP